MSDKVKKLAEKLEYAARPDIASGKRVPVILDLERILRAELEPLLEALAKAHRFIRGKHSTITYGPKKLCDELAAELQNWTARTPDGR